MLSRRSDWLRRVSSTLRSRSSAFLWVMSLPMADAPVIVPFGSWIGEMVTETSSTVPSLQIRLVSCCSTSPPLAIRVSASSSSSRPSGGKSSEMWWPTTSLALYPYIFSAPRFQLVIVPRGSSRGSRRPRSRRSLPAARPSPGRSQGLHRRALLRNDGLHSLRCCHLRALDACLSNVGSSHLGPEQQLERWAAGSAGNKHNQQPLLPIYG